ncbi:probable disease resistance protein At5g66900 isoform X2 [Prosopis cineraria]|uniref:probable disease resistance protein At5g66900 isoform X2 n=1 Tax=Prosopis cineraria TaxID=364024 RepID=UPI00240F7A10|nr:probable disease resistance protein At5g66900 isoform X2 [Prosopis cineraria]
MISLTVGGERHYSSVLLFLFSGQYSTSMEAFSTSCTILGAISTAVNIVQKCLEAKNIFKNLPSTTKNLRRLLEDLEPGMKTMDFPAIVTELMQKLKDMNEASQGVVDKNKLTWSNFCCVPCFLSKYDEAYQSAKNFCAIEMQVMMLTCLMRINFKLGQTNEVADQETDNSSSESVLPQNRVTVNLVGQCQTMDCLKYGLLHDDQQVLNLIGLTGSGKTTLAGKLCHDVAVKGRFNDSIIFEKLGSQSKSNEAYKKLKEKLSNRAYPVLLVLDDVWTDSGNIIERLTGSIPPNSKILVTSRGQITTLGTTYRMESLSPEDAETLFFHFVRQRDIDFDH